MILKHIRSHALLKTKDFDGYNERKHLVEIRNSRMKHVKIFTANEKTKIIINKTRRK